MTDINQYEPLWGSWYIDAPIGEGSFGKVYRVKREEFGRTHYSAVKMIAIPQSEADLRQAKADGLDGASMRSYFRSFVEDIVQEIDLMSEFKGNSNIVSFEDYKIVEKQNGFGYDILIRMELLTSLPDRAAEKPLTESEVIKLGVDICRALELCAQKNVIHRDIKPDNIFVSQYGDYKLGDFGIARQIERTTSGLSKKGTYTYMEPEVFKGGEYGASVDVYSLGIVMYRCLNRGRTPFMPDYPAPITPRNREEALSRRTNGERIPPIAGVGRALNAAVLKACAYDRAARCASAAEMRAALEAIAGGGSDDRERTDSMDSTVGVFEQWAGAGEYRYAKGDIPHNAVRMKYTDGEHTGYASVLDMSNTLAPDTLLAIDSAGAALYEKTGVRLVVLAERRTERFTEGFRYYVESNILPFFNFSRLATSKWILLALQIDDCLSCAICGEGAKKIELNLNDRFYSHFVGGEYVRAVEEAIRQIERQTFTA